MGLPASGAISINDVNVELGNTATAQIDMNSAAVRGLFGIGSGAISMSDGYGKSSQFSFSITSNVNNASLATLATNAGWNGSSALVATINAGVYCSSTHWTAYGMIISGSFPGGVTLINNGFIVGRGGSGGRGATSSVGTAGGVGGTALVIQSPVSIYNNGTIAGGGGGGGGGNSTYWSDKGSSAYAQGGGGGGGASGLVASIGAVYGPSQGCGNNTYGNGALGQWTSGGYGRAGTGGRGGARGAAGIAGVKSSGQLSRAGGAPGAGGLATSGQSNVTWLATGTRIGGLG